MADKEKVKNLFDVMQGLKERPSQEGLDAVNLDIRALSEDESDYLAYLMAGDLAKREEIIKRGFELFAMYRLARSTPRFVDAMRTAFYYGVSHAKTAYDLALSSPEDDEELVAIGSDILKGLDEEMERWVAEQRLREMPTEGEA